MSWRHHHIGIVDDVPTFRVSIFKRSRTEFKTSVKIPNRHLESLSFSITGQIYPKSSPVGENRWANAYLSLQNPWLFQDRYVFLRVFLQIFPEQGLNFSNIGASPFIYLLLSHPPGSDYPTVTWICVILRVMEHNYATSDGKMGTISAATCHSQFCYLEKQSWKFQCNYNTQPYTQNLLNKTSLMFRDFITRLIYNQL